MEGKICVLTGASKGIGRAIAMTLADKGVFLVLLARGQEALDKMLQDVKDAGGNGMAIACSISDRDGMLAMAKKVMDEVGVPDFLINNAGAWAFQDFCDNDYSSWDWMIDVNIRGHLNAISAFLPAMKKENKGHIINITSDSERVPFPGVTVYTGCKFFMDGCMQALRMELKNTNIKITNILPGFVWTDGLERTLRDPVQAKAMKDLGLGDPELFIEKKDLMIQPEDMGTTVYDVMKSGKNYYVYDMMVRDKLQEMV